MRLLCLPLGGLLGVLARMLRRLRCATRADAAACLPRRALAPADERSPLCGHTHDSLMALNAEIVVTFEGTTEVRRALEWRCGVCGGAAEQAVAETVATCEGTTEARCAPLF